MPRPQKQSSNPRNGKDADEALSLPPFVEVIPPGSEKGSLEDLELRVVRRIIWLARRWRNALDEALRGSGDSHARWLALLWIDLLDGTANHRELAERVGVELPTLVRLLNRLEAEKLVKRQSLGRKGRAKSVVLTKRGRERLANMSAIVKRTRAGFTEGLSAESLRQAMPVLDTMLARYVRVVEWQRPQPPRKSR